MISRLWLYLHSSDPLTWLGHTVWGFVTGAAYYWLTRDTWLIGAALALLLAFGIREWPKIATVFGKREPILMRDSVLDFAAPYVGLILFGLLISLIQLIT